MPQKILNFNRGPYFYFTKAFSALLRVTCKRVLRPTFDQCSNKVDKELAES
jgi:hypothetical protein